MVVSILLYLMSNGGKAMRFMFIMVRSLQLIMHLPMVQIVFPGNVMMMIGILIPVVGFDILESVFEWESLNQMIKVFDFNEHNLIGEKISLTKNIKRVWLHTCSLDHKNALNNYIARGMKIFKTETVII